MRNPFILIVVSFLFVSCKYDKKETSESAEKELSVAEKIANANGFENWNEVSQIDFTFNVDKDTIHFERSWSWKPKTGDVTLISGKDTISYNQKSLDSTTINADRKFINDKYWLLAPFQLVWDSSASISEVSTENAPISSKSLNKITLTYPTEGGYTPGDAYDFYFDKDYMIKEWIYRQGDSKEPSMMTTWEDYEDFNGIEISKSHKKPEGDWKLHFTNIKITK
ncbi:MAG: hypothetical protein R2797_04280 [Gelidibacter sp.]